MEKEEKEHSRKNLVRSVTQWFFHGEASLQESKAKLQGTGSHLKLSRDLMIFLDD